MADKENARELYNALVKMLDLFKSGKVPLPSIKKLVGGRSMLSLTLHPDPNLWRNLSPEQHADVSVLMVIAEVEAVLEAHRKTYGKAGQSA